MLAAQRTHPATMGTTPDPPGAQPPPAIPPYLREEWLYRFQERLAITNDPHLAHREATTATLAIKHHDRQG